MAKPTTTRRDMLRLGTSAAAYAAGAAIVTGGVALASEAKGAAGVSPELLHLIGVAKRAEAAARHHDDTVHMPAWKRKQEAIEAATASLRHVTADAGEGMGGGRIMLTTAEPTSVHMARSSIKRAREGKWNVDDGGEYLRAARRVSIAAHWHERTIARVKQAHDLSASTERSNDLSNASADAADAVAGFTPRSLADMQCKLAFMVENHMGNGVDCLPQVVADIDALAKAEGR